MKNAIVIKLLIGIVVFCQAWTLNALSPNKLLSQYIREAWNTGDGIPQPSITSITQTQDGYIWIGTQEGLARFDGVKFTVFDKNNTEALKNNFITALLGDKNGNLWIGTDGYGIIRYSEGLYTTYTTENGIAADMVSTLYEDRRGAVWIGSLDGKLSRFKDGHFTKYGPHNGLPNGDIYEIYEDRRGNFWFCTGSGLCRWPNRPDGKIEIFSTNNGLPHQKVNAFHEDRRGYFWIATEDGLLRWTGTEGLTPALISEKTIKRFTKKNGLPGNIVRTIFEDRSGTLWIGTLGGLKRFRNGEPVDENPVEGLTEHSIRCFLEDHEGSLWFGLEAAGLLRLRDGKFTAYTAREGLLHNQVWTIFQDRRDTFWIGTERGINRFRDGKFTSITEKDGLTPGRIMAISGDRSGNLWIGTYSSGITLMENGKFTVYNTKNGLSNDRVTSVYIDHDDSLWVGTVNGLNHFKDGKFTSYTTGDGMSHDNVRGVFRDREGALWIGTLGGGLNRLKNGTFTTFSAKDGIPCKNVLSFYQDLEGSIWIGTFGGGLARLKNGKFNTYTTKNGLFNDSVFQALEDHRENLWMSCNRGIFRVNKQDIRDFDNGKIDSIPCTAYGTEDGMINKECNGGFQPGAWKAADGTLWFTTIKGLVKIDPAKLNPNKIPPRLIIEKVKVEDQIFDHRHKIHLNPGKNDLEIYFTATSFVVPGRVRFQYKLEGVNNKWIDAGTRRIAYFTNIPPGNHRFKVKACNDDGLWNNAGEYCDIYLESYFYQTKWFYFLVGILVFFTAIATYRRRVEKLRSRKEELEQMMEERTGQLKESFLQLEEANKELEKLSIVARETDNAVMIMDPEGNINWVNEGFIRMYETTLDQLRAGYGVNIVDCSSNSEIRSLLEQCIREKKTVSYESFETTRSGKKLWSHTTLTPILGKNGEVKRLIAIDTDITRIKKAEETAEKANQAKSEFLARMSHELRTPMNGIIGFTQMIMESHLNDEQMDYAKTISRSSDAMTVLLDDILDFSRIEARELTFDPIDFDPEITVFDVCDLIIPRIGAKPVEVLCRIGDNVPAYIKSDAGRFRQILLNLVGNAVKFTDEGEIEVSMEVMEEKGKRLKLYIKVRDTGIGVPPDKRDTIFDAFQQSDGSITRRFGGTGLGLAICRQIAKLMEGDIWVESEPGKGSIFYFTAWVEKSSKPPVKKIKMEFLEGKKVLLLDDSKSNLDILCKLLERAHMKVFPFDNPDSALMAVRQCDSEGTPFDICVTATQLAGSNGMEFARHIRNLKTTRKKPPLLALSSPSASHRTGKNRHSMFDGFLPKPVQREKMLKMLEYLLGNKKNELEEKNDENKTDHQKDNKAVTTQHSVKEAVKHSIHILVAEDNPINQKLVRALLTRAGYRITIAENGLETVNTYLSGPETYHLILMDVQMPEMDGKEATRKIREKGFKDVPIIAMTAESMKGDREKCLEAGMNDYIAKPIKRGIVFEMVKKWCL